jgi:hypothetical protein
MQSTDLLKLIAQQRAEMELAAEVLFDKAKASGVLGSIPDDVLKAFCRLEAKRLVREVQDAAH